MIKESFDSYNYVHTPRRRKTRVKTSGYTIRPTTDNSYIAQLQRAPKRHITNDIYAVTLHKNDQVGKLLEYYMGKNTMERQNFIIDNLVIEEDLPDADSEPLD